MKILVIILCAIISGCKDIDDFKCSAEQIDLVKKEVDICSKTGYLDSTCFRQAKMTICEEIKSD